MAYDEGLAERVREVLLGQPEFTEKRMFGGLCFLIREHMCCGIVGDTLMARVGPDAYERCLALPHVRPMDFTGKPMKGMVYVDSEAVTEDEELAQWLGRCLQFVETLPPKKRK